MIKTGICISVGLVLLIAVMSFIPVGTVYSQSPFEIATPNTPDATFVRFDPAQHPAFVNSIKSLTFPNSASYAVVLTNQSDQAIKALTVQWTITDRAGRTTHRLNSQNDSFLFMPGPVLQPGKQRMFSLGEWDLKRLGIDEANLGKVSVSLDLAIFEDGHIVGPDAANMVEQLRVRRQVVLDLLQNVRRVIAEGQDLKTALVGPASYHGSVQNLYLHSSKHVAQEILMSPNPMTMINHLSQEPEPPVFFRR